MAKQVVTETRISEENIKIETSYEFEPFLIGKKEREEVTIGNVTKYWVYVPETIEGVVQSYAEKKDIITARRKIKETKKKTVWNNLQEEKIARMNRYREMIEAGEEIIPAEKDYESARKLQKISLRAQNKKLCKLV